MNDYRELHELYHFGILGMHWGVRRYQNPDGTLTEEGKRRYNLSDEKAYSEFKKGEVSIKNKAEAAATLGSFGSFMGAYGGIAAGMAAGAGPAILAVPMVAMGGVYTSYILANKIGNKKIDQLKQSYNKDRIDKVDEIVRKFADSKIDIIAENLKKQGYDFDDSVKRAVSNKMVETIAEGLGSGKITVKDVKNSYPKEGITVKDEQIAKKELLEGMMRQEQERQQVEQQWQTRQHIRRHHHHY